MSINPVGGSGPAWSVRGVNRAAGADAAGAVSAASNATPATNVKTASAIMGSALDRVAGMTSNTARLQGLARTHGRQIAG